MADAAPAVRAAKLERLRAVFDMCDDDSTNMLNIDQLRRALELLDSRGGYGSEDQARRVSRRRSAGEEVEWVFALHDRNHDDRIDFHEFTRMCDAVHLRSLFDDIDTDGSGSISVDELMVVLRSLGFAPSREQLAAMMSVVDANGSDTIEFAEFADVFGALDELSLQSLSTHLISMASLSVGNDFVPDLPPRHMELWKFLAAGAAAGGVSKTITAPLERIKVLQQASEGTAPRATSIFRRILASEGWAGLLRGNAASIAQVVPFGAIVCLLYSQLCAAQPERVDVPPGEPWPAWRALAGATAGVTATVVTFPLDVVRTHMSVQTISRSGTLHTGAYDVTVAASVRRLVAEGGVSSLYRGLLPTLGSIAPFMAVQMASYDMLKARAPAYLPESIHGLADSIPFFLGCGVVAGMVAQAVTHPVDLIRRRLQLGTDAFQYSSTANAVTSIVRSDGIRGLFRGLGPAAVKVAPAVASGLVVRDSVLRYLEA
ncbi:calcium-binding carrier protein SCaMC-3 [Thecamonas trahens ATCC 50062]|uniref:Calcium-binding carrier protein SCaMC-3 n=1 Tax=Thecamonas trahens ATCC 50062 TaxID=461836 RepID=A0A0L0DA90_THETB|nr:calcium-binding carrier protein SCaMC-3 [Thecamonas trahens ATCC 50062]KNC48213.1 calcium-binding carrier protein SCaMC-3 [Thecamonas trahens ATCC 50062]|eukprot:XP_013758782.1 calcium-binding carrier protein SCaMC-3 [Thecamonas trahens ATCC 50062]